MNCVKSKKTYKLSASVLALLVLIGGGLWWNSTHVRPKLVYTSQGFGGFTPASKPKESHDPLKVVKETYNSGKYKDAETLAQRFIDSNSSTHDLVMRKKVVEARDVLAFSAARRKDMRLARDRFAVLRIEAAKFPKEEKPVTLPNQFEPPLTEEGAYQHAVCTAALGEKDAAEAEYMTFMHDFPESTLLNGVIMRLQRLHNGHLPKTAETAWLDAQKVAKSRAKERQKNDSMCAPECLAELLRRRGEKPDVRALAEEMKTSDEGTSMQSLSDSAKKHGYKTEGLSLTQKGLSKQPLPLIALVMGHYVIIEKVNLLGVTIWDPYGKGIGHPSTTHYSTNEWSKLWSGVALVMNRNT